MHTIREVQQSDLDRLKSLATVLASVHIQSDARRYLPISVAWREYADQLSGKSTEDRPLIWLVAEVEGTIVGYLLAEHLAEDRLTWSPEHVCVHDIFVDPRCRAQGVGRSLMQGAVSWARHRNVPQLRLFTDRGNDRAREVFAAAGFRPTMVEMTLDLQDVSDRDGASEGASNSPTA